MVYPFGLNHFWFLRARFLLWLIVYLELHNVLTVLRFFSHKNYLLLLPMLAAVMAGAQTTDVYHQAGTLYLSPGVVFYVNGSVVTAAGSRVENDGGSINIAGGSWVNRGKYSPKNTAANPDTIRLIGSTSQLFHNKGAGASITDGDTVGFLSIQNSSTPLDWDSTSYVGQRLEHGAIINTSDTDRLYFTETGQSLTAPTDTQFVNGPVYFARTGTNENYPGVGLGANGVLQFALDSLSLVGNYTAGTTIRIEAFDTGTGGIPLPDRKLARLSPSRYLKLEDVGVAGDVSSLLTTIRFSEVPEETNNDIMRLAYQNSDLLPNGVLYDTLNRTSQTGTDFTSEFPGTVDDNFPLFLTVGVNKVQAGAIAALIPLSGFVCPGDTGQINLAGADATGTNFQWQDSTGSATFNNLAGQTNDVLNTDTLFADRAFRVIADGGIEAFRYENDTTASFKFGVTDNVAMKVRAFLEGPYNGTSMGLPNPVFADLEAIFKNAVQPDTTRMYAASKYTAPANAVDVIAVELRTVRDDATSLVAGSSKLAWLLSDGTIADFRTGDTGINVAYSCDDNIDPNAAYYVVIRHRNHLPMITASPVSFTPGIPTLVDFTNPNVVYHWIPTIQLGGRYYPSTNLMALFAGNVVNQAGEVIDFVNSLDYSRVFFQQGLLTGYVLDDVNCDGVVTSLDIPLVQANNDKLRYSNVRD